MAEKNFLSWVGFKGEDESKPAPTQNALERIRELENQLNDLRSRKDITGLSREEFEILATETAMSMIKSAQQREARANAAANKFAGTLSALIPGGEDGSGGATSFLGFQITNLYEFFILFIIMSGAAAAILFVLSSWLEKRMHNDHVEGQPE